MKSQASRIDRVIKGLIAYQPEKIILFGSMARGDSDEYSDIDLIVVKDIQRRFVQRLVDITEFLPADMAVDVLVYTPKELADMLAEGNPFLEHALKDAIVLYEKSPGDS